jgi:putative transposase
MSAYTQAINIYIHQNPLIDGLVHRIEDWEFSSFLDFIGFRNGTLVNKELAFEITGLDKADFYKQSYMSISDFDFDNSL